MVFRASPEHADILSTIGAETFYNAHKDSAPAHEIAAYMKKVYSPAAIEKEVSNPINIYHIIKHEGIVAGFSKMEFTMEHPAIKTQRISKMDQIYLLDSFQGLKLGAKLLNYNIDLSKSHGQNGMWLVVWTKNTTAISFYKKFGFRIVVEDQFNLTETHINPCYVMLLEYPGDRRAI
jgi:ribosomal protein S18 acetylase RimI-like enzyme